MVSYNVKSYGEKIRVNFNTDISSASTYSMIIEPESGDEQALTPTLGTSNVTVGDETLVANQYVEYTTTENQFLDFIGRYRVKAAYDAIWSDYILFRVMP